MNLIPTCFTRIKIQPLSVAATPINNNAKCLPMNSALKLVQGDKCLVEDETTMVFFNVGSTGGLGDKILHDSMG